MTKEKKAAYIKSILKTNKELEKRFQYLFRKLNTKDLQVIFQIMQHIVDNKI